MKYWTQHEKGMVTLTTLAGNLLDDERVVDLIPEDDGSIVFREACDGYFSITFSPTEAIEALQEAIDWIKGQQEAK